MSLTAPPVENLPQPTLLIGPDRLPDSSGGVFPHRYAATGAVTTDVVMAGPVEMDRAVGEARTAQQGWERMSPPERRGLLLRLADLIARDSASLADITTIENGTPRQVTAHVADVAAELFRYNAGWTDRIEGTVIPTWPGDALDYATEKPYGVVAVIIPWNGPLISLGMTVAPALAAGNTVVVKPPEVAPYSAIRLGELALEAGFPPGVLNVVAAGPSGGEALVTHPGVDKIHFTGSGATAKRILATALTNLTPVGLELGGKSANLVFGDIDTASTVPGLLWGLINLSGQGCINPTRILVQDNIYDEVIDIATAVIGQIPMGDPFAAQTVMGPVIDDAACQRILGMIDRAAEGNARIVTGGRRMTGDLADGYFIEPTIVADVDNTSYIAQHEVFGPVLSFLRFSDEDDAVRMANDTDFGLAGYVHTNDLRRAHRVADRLAAGNVWINGFAGIPAAAPFGGVKNSGVGRLGGKWGIREFTQPKNVWVGL